MTKQFSYCCNAEVTSRTELAGITYYCPTCGKPCNTIQLDKRVEILREKVQDYTGVWMFLEESQDIMQSLSDSPPVKPPTVEEIKAVLTRKAEKLTKNPDGIVRVLMGNQFDELAQEIHDMGGK